MEFVNLNDVSHNTTVNLHKNTQVRYHNYMFILPANAQFQNQTVRSRLIFDQRSSRFHKAWISLWDGGLVTGLFLYCSCCKVECKKGRKCGNDRCTFFHPDCQTLRFKDFDECPVHPNMIGMDIRQIIDVTDVSTLSDQKDSEMDAISDVSDSHFELPSMSAKIAPMRTEKCMNTNTNTNTDKHNSYFNQVRKDMKQMSQVVTNNTFLCDSLVMNDKIIVKAANEGAIPYLKEACEKDKMFKNLERVHIHSCILMKHMAFEIGLARKLINQHIDVTGRIASITVQHYDYKTQSIMFLHIGIKTDYNEVKIIAGEKVIPTIERLYGLSL
jgi:hypothetical protein